MGFFSKLSERKKEKREREERVKLLFQAMKDYNPGPQIDYKPQVTKKSANKEPQHSHPEQAQPTKQQQQAGYKTDH